MLQPEEYTGPKTVVSVDTTYITHPYAIIPFRKCQSFVEIVRPLRGGQAFAAPLYVSDRVSVSDFQISHTQVQWP